jgi:predicted lipoprotein with Yx(FWY)xxD motif
VHRFLTLISSACLMACATSLAAPAAHQGGGLADAKGMTLYVFKKDAPQVSTCYDACAKSWPPFLAPPGATAIGDFSVVHRKDGSRQWAYRSMPLYYFFGDDLPGMLAGDGMGAAWFVVRDDGVAKPRRTPAQGGFGY